MSEIDATAARALAENAEWMAAEGLLIDVREHDEWQRGRSPLAQHVPLSEFGDHVHTLPRDRQILVVCHGGGRSSRVTEALRADGYDAVNVAGGMVEWHRGGGEIVTDGSEPARVD